MTVNRLNGTFYRLNGTFYLLPQNGETVRVVNCTHEPVRLGRPGNEVVIPRSGFVAEIKITPIPIAYLEKGENQTLIATFKTTVTGLPHPIPKNTILIVSEDVFQAIHMDDTTLDIGDSRLSIESLRAKVATPVELVVSDNRGNQEVVKALLIGPAFLRWSGVTFGRVV